MIAEADLLRRFEAVRRQKPGDWMVRCPAHEDSRPSLHVTLGRDRWLLHCLAGCTPEDVLAAAKIEAADLFQAANERRNGRHIVAAYPYVDEHDELLFEVVRFEPKDFRQRRPTGNAIWSNSGWTWDLKGVRRVLYRLPRVVQAVAKGETIYVVEGEEDVNALERAGKVATTNPGGAGKWRDDYSPVLAGTNVVIVADRDEPGRKHAAKVARSLTGVARAVWVVEPFEGKDARDHLRAGHPVEAFVPFGGESHGKPDIPPDPPTVPAPATADLLRAVGAFVRRFVILPTPSCYLAVALFVLHTWAFEAAYATPYVIVESPEKQSGKTRLLEVLQLLCFKAVAVASISPAGLYQTIGKGHPTLLVDEADAIFAGSGDRNEELRGVLNAGNAPQTAKVIRGGKTGEAVTYSTYCPKVIAGIATGKLPDTVRNRAIVVPIDRKLKEERTERLRVRRLYDELEVLTAQLQAWALKRHAYLIAYDLPTPLDEVSDRLEEAWEPLLAIASLGGEDWEAKARSAAIELATGDVEEGETTSHRLLFALQTIFGANRQMRTSDILLALNLDEQWAAWNNGKGITARNLAKYLKPYRVKPKDVWLGEKSYMGYRAEQFARVWARYAPSPRDPSPGAKSDPKYPRGDDPVSGTETSGNPDKHRDLGDSGIEPPGTGGGGQQARFPCSCTDGGQGDDEQCSRCYGQRETSR
jgi:Protein of unknown function (DUF3631)